MLHRKAPGKSLAAAVTRSLLISGPKFVKLDLGPTPLCMLPLLPSSEPLQEKHKASQDTVLLAAPKKRQRGPVVRGEADGTTEVPLPVFYSIGIARQCFLLGDKFTRLRLMKQPLL